MKENVNPLFNVIKFGNYHKQKKQSMFVKSNSKAVEF